MTFLQRIYADKRRVIVPLAVALLANLLIWLVAVLPLGRKVDAVALRVSRAQDAVQNADLLLARSQAVAHGKREADTELRTFYDEVLPQGLPGARRITYVRLAQLAAESGLQYERRTVRTVADVDSALAKLEMTMVLAGEYADVRRFIYRLETDSEFLVIENVALAQGDEGGAPLVLTVDVSTYYRPDADGT